MTLLPLSRSSVNKPLGTSICVSGDVAARADGFLGRPIGDLMLKGRSEPIRALEPLTPAEHAEPGTGTYKAFAMMEAGDLGLRRPGRQSRRRPARELPPEAASQRRDRASHRTALSTHSPVEVPHRPLRSTIRRADLLRPSRSLRSSRNQYEGCPAQSSAPSASIRRRSWTRRAQSGSLPRFSGGVGPSRAITGASRSSAAPALR